MGLDGMGWERDIQSYLTHLFFLKFWFLKREYIHTEREEKKEIDSIVKCISQSRSTLHRFENR